MTNTYENTRVTLRREPDSFDGKSYTVLMNDEEVGTVFQITVTHDRKPRGARIVTSRTQSLRWVCGGSSYRLWTDTRWESVYRILTDLGVGWNDAERLAKEAPVVKFVEAPAASKKGGHNV